MYLLAESIINIFVYMSDRMRDILNELMSRKGDTPTSLSKRTGVPQPTIHRFMNGKVRDMKSENAIKIAVSGYGITESQLRGDVPIEWLNIELPTSSTEKNTENPDVEKILKHLGITKENLTVAQVDRFSEFLKFTPEQQLKALEFGKEEQKVRGKETGNGNESK